MSNKRKLTQGLKAALALLLTLLMTISTFSQVALAVTATTVSTPIALNAPAAPKTATKTIYQVAAVSYWSISSLLL